MTAEPALDEKIALIARALAAAGIAHAFGGALALAYYAEPRSTIDVDVNIFTPADNAPRVFTVLDELGATIDPVEHAAAVQRDGQVRIRWGRSPIDLFFSYDPFHDACRDAVRQVPFGDVQIPILSPEHLVVFKTVFDRRKDWLDIEQVLFLNAGEIDRTEIADWLDRLLTPPDSRPARIARLMDATLGAESEAP